MVLQNTVHVNCKDQEFKPPRIPVARTNETTKYLLLLGGLLIIASVLSGDDVSPLFGGLWISIAIILLFMVELLKRCVMFCEEKNHIKSRYKNDWTVLLQQLFSIQSSISFFASVIYLILYYNLQGSTSIVYLKTDLLRIGLVFIAVILNSHHLKLKANSVDRSLNINDMKPLDIGSAMAYSIYYGYLKIVLPPNDSSQYGIIQQIQKYESSMSVKFSRYKLYLLVPLSCHCPKSLMDKSSPSVSIAKPLETQVRHRAGVTHRDFHNAVYKIELEDKLLYVCAEFATPLNTMEDAIRSGDKDAVEYNKYKPDIVLNFYTTLKHLIEINPETKGLCELIFYDDCIDKIPLDVGKVIANYIAMQDLRQKKF